MLIFDKKYADHIEISQYTVCREDETSTGISTPEKIDGLPVTVIGDGSFCDCGLASVILPETITIIGDDAFYFCHSLTSITIPENVKIIKPGAFLACSADPIIVKSTDCEFEEIYVEGYMGGERTPFYGIAEGGGTRYFGTIYGYENSTAQAIAEKEHYDFELLEPESSSEQDDSEEITVLNSLGQDVNQDGKTDDADMQILLQYTASHHAGNVQNFSDFLAQYG